MKSTCLANSSLFANLLFLLTSGAMVGVSGGVGQQAERPGGQHTGGSGSSGLPGPPDPDLQAGTGGQVGQPVSPGAGAHLQQLRPCPWHDPGQRGQEWGF